MASSMIEILGDMLITQPIERFEYKMPSPEQLKFKFIIKHKRLPEQVDGDGPIIIRLHDCNSLTIYFKLLIIVY